MPISTRSLKGTRVMAAETATQTITLNPAYFGSADWIKSFSETPAKLYAGCFGKALDLAADRLQDQAAYLKSLSKSY
jgi:hypothetical protein